MGCWFTKQDAPTELNGIRLEIKNKSKDDQVSTESNINKNDFTINSFS
jgi:hypothetical protein